MIKQLETAISKLSELSDAEQEAIAQVIMTTIENKQSSPSAWDTLKEMAGSIDETTLLSESSLAKDWLSEEEDKAWQNL